MEKARGKKPVPKKERRGGCSARLGKFERAVADYTRALELNPNYARAYHNRGLAYDQLGEIDRAIADYSKALELNPSYALAYYHRGLAYQKQGRPELAQADWKRAQELLDPSLLGRTPSPDSSP